MQILIFSCECILIFWQIIYLLAKLFIYLFKLNRPFFSLADDQRKVICYFTNWAWYRKGTGKYLPQDIDPELCSHIIYGFASLDPNTLTIRAQNKWADINNGM